MVNPNSYVREGFVTALAGIGVPVYAKKVPKDVTPTPRVYVLISSQTKNEYARDKDGFDWMCSILFDIVNVNEKGYSNPDVVDGLEEQIMNIASAEVPVPRFRTVQVELVDSTDLDAETATQSIDRRLLTYGIWLNNID